MSAKVEVDTERLLLIVVGAHLAAEVADRPIAHGLRDRIEAWVKGDIEGAGLDQQPSDGESVMMPLVCTDVWYLNHKELHRQPTVSLGGPEVNAVSAFLYPRVPVALSIEKKLTIHLEVEMLDLRAAIWGMDAGHTAAGVQLFEEKYLGDFLGASADEIGMGE